jgi:hypothetical protein
MSARTRGVAATTGATVSPGAWNAHATADGGTILIDTDRPQASRMGTETTRGRARLSERRVVDEDDDFGPAALDREPEPVREPDVGPPMGGWGLRPEAGDPPPTRSVPLAGKRRKMPGLSRSRTGAEPAPMQCARLHSVLWRNRGKS